MNKQDTLDKVLPGIYQIRIPLIDSPLKYLNSYLLLGREKNLLIDTGFNHSECLDTLLSALQSMGADIGNTDIFITHFHADHIGLVNILLNPDSRVYFNQADADRLATWIKFTPLLEGGKKNGFPQEGTKEALLQHPGFVYGLLELPEFDFLSDGEVLEYGDYKLQCLQTPGHTPGHMCLYEPNKNVLFAGDHLLVDITPNIQCWSQDRDPLNEFLRSLERIDQLSVDLVLPGHRKIFTDHRQRIKELQTHHEQRLREILSILQEGPQTAYQVASRIAWDIVFSQWEKCDLFQRWFATGEASAHLHYLENQGKIVRCNENPVVYTKRDIN